VCVLVLSRNVADGIVEKVLASPKDYCYANQDYGVDTNKIVAVFGVSLSTARAVKLRANYQLKLPKSGV